MGENKGGVEVRGDGGDGGPWRGMGVGPPEHGWLVDIFEHGRGQNAELHYRS